MSVDPAAVSAASAAANAAAANTAAVEALIQSEIQALAADAQALQSQVSTGQVVTAQVLPSNGMGDLITILGNRVAAQLPPTLAPGDTFTAQVTGFNGDQILLQVLTAAESQIAAENARGALTPAPPQAPLSPLQAAATRPPLPEGVSPSVAPPPAVFVAASVRPAPADLAPAPAQLPPTQVAQQQNVLLADIEARLLAARAAQISVNAPTGTPLRAPVSPPPGLSVPLPPQPAAGTPAEAPPAAAQSTPQTPVPVQFPGRFTIPPAILTSPRFADPVATTAANDAPPATGLAAFKDAVPLVRALGLPVTPTNVAAANLALKTPQRLPAALLTLESALPDGDDSRVATLRTLTAFIGKLDPQSSQLAAQISAYVDNVVTGNEPKLAQLLTAQLTADQAATPAAAAAAETAAQNAPAPAPGAPVPLPVVPQATLPVMALAQLAERGAALSVDLKAQILALVNASPANAAAEFAPAASAALSAITSVQLNAAQAMSATPQTMQFTLPMFLNPGYAQARVAIDRDAPDSTGSRSLDGDNFHIAFVLDTKHLGTVTIDLQTVGRAFSLAVKTESEHSAQRFGDSLAKLTDRLETLRYRVNSAEASVAARGSAPADVPGAPEPLDDGIPSDVNVRA